MDYKAMQTFRFWCQKILPLVYDDSLSYYELLCKVVDYINDLINNDKAINAELTEVQKDLDIINKWIEDFGTEYAEKVLAEHIATMILVEITDSGYIVYYMPSTWDDFKFNTTGLDIELPQETEYGHLVLSY